LINQVDITRLRATWERSMTSHVRARIQVAVWNATVKDGDPALGQQLLQLLDDMDAVGLVSLRVALASDGCVVCGREFTLTVELSSCEQASLRM
jgi:methionine aminopeptidase